MQRNVKVFGMLLVRVEA